MPGEREPQACTLVIFGATGDLTRRKLVPGLYSLAREGLLPRHFAVVAFARRDKTHDQFRNEMRQAITEFARYPLDESLWNAFASGIYYHRSTFDDALPTDACRNCCRRWVSATRRSITPFIIWRRLQKPITILCTIYTLLAWAAAARRMKAGRAWWLRNPLAMIWPRRVS